MRELNMGLCLGRHEIKEVTDCYFFPNEVDPTKPELLEIASNAVIEALIKAHKEVKINLYVTGLTVSLIAVLNSCKKHGVSITLFHFNRDTNTYFPQQVV
jgi:hypothetical protein